MTTTAEAPAPLIPRDVGASAFWGFGPCMETKMNHDDRKKLYAALSAPFSAGAVERTDGSVTGRGYSTTGIKTQMVVNRLNEVMGLGGYRIDHRLTVKTASTSKGRTVYEANCELTLQLGEWGGGAFVIVAEAKAIGGHASVLEVDALKGALTNALKRAAGFLGCGRQAYEGTLDDDNLPGTFADDAGTHQDQRPASQRSPPPSADAGGHGERNRLTSKQLAALWALARKLDIDKVAFRNRVKERFGVTVEFLGRGDASTIIGELSAKLGNGHAQHGDAGGEAA